MCMYTLQVASIGPDPMVDVWRPLLLRVNVPYHTPVNYLDADEEAPEQLLEFR